MSGLDPSQQDVDISSIDATISLFKIADEES
jgi:hypothetical protein